MKHENRTRPGKLLDERAEQLARCHQKRLDTMTEAALDRSSRHRSGWLSPQPAIVFASLSVAVLAWWAMPSPESEIPAPAPQMAVIPAWVLDDQVPLEILASQEFYRWLAKQTPEASETEQRG